MTMDWQPIETVPDDEYVLLARDDGCMVVMKGWIARHNEHLSHWMPLPEPPSRENSTKQ